MDSVSMVARIVQRLGVRVGIDARTLGAHSLRSGAATELAEQGASLFEIKRKGRWRSTEAVERYVRQGDTLTSDPMRRIKAEAKAPLM